MSIDAFLYFEGKSEGGEKAIEIDGETVDDFFSKKKAIQLFSWTWGLTNSVSIGSASSGLGAGRASPSSLNVSKKVDTSSPLLMLACATGAHFPKATLAIRKSGGKNSDVYQTIIMETVFVENLQWGGGQDEAMENMSLAFAKFTVQYAMQDDKGKLGTAVPGIFNFQTNKVG